MGEGPALSLQPESFRSNLSRRPKGVLPDKRVKGQAPFDLNGGHSSKNQIIGQQVFTFRQKH